MSDDLELKGRRALVTRRSRPISNDEKRGPSPYTLPGERSACDSTAVRGCIPLRRSRGRVEAVAPVPVTSALVQN
jgi:hypothetical protein